MVMKKNVFEEKNEWDGMRKKFYSQTSIFQVIDALWYPVANIGRVELSPYSNKMTRSYWIRRTRSLLHSKTIERFETNAQENRMFQNALPLKARETILNQFRQKSVNLSRKFSSRISAETLDWNICNIGDRNKMEEFEWNGTCYSTHWGLTGLS